MVYSPPSKKSFTYQVLNSLINGLKKSNHDIEVSDLYVMKFRSDMSEEEYEREGFATDFWNIKPGKEKEFNISGRNSYLNYCNNEEASLDSD